MAGLGPAIHVFPFGATNKQGVDARHKAGKDEKKRANEEPLPRRPERGL